METENKTKEPEPFRRKMEVKRKLKTGMNKLNQFRKEEKPSIIKAVMFVPCMKDSDLYRELREAENTILERTGAKLKMVERCGGKLMDILTTLDPWRGKDCMRENAYYVQQNPRVKKHTKRMQ